MYVCICNKAQALSAQQSIDQSYQNQVPNTWRSVVQDPGTMQLFLDFYKSTQARGYNFGTYL